jgi:hypothetical protein
MSFLDISNNSIFSIHATPIFPKGRSLPKPVSRGALLLIQVMALCTFFFFSLNSASADNLHPACKNKLKGYAKQKNEVASLGGLWGLFEQNEKLRAHSIKAIQLDSKINHTFASLEYLCTTVSGVPFNELADYIAHHLQEMDEKQFREHHDVLGKPAKVIDTWLKYYKIAVVIRERKLNLEQIRISLEAAESLFTNYHKLAQDISADKPEKNFLNQARQLAEEINHFQTQDKYMVQAINEEAQVPYWDIEENYGGS